MLRGSVLLLFFSLFIVSVSSVAQQPSRSHVFFEGLGPGGVFSVNYEFRINGKPDGLGVRGGVGYMHKNSLTLPVIVNYLLGGRGHYLETGAGLTFATDPVKTSSWSGPDHETKWLTAVTLGYRIQPDEKGATFRIGYSPFVNKYPVWYWGYLSIGYKF